MKSSIKLFIILTIILNGCANQKTNNSNIIIPDIPPLKVFPCDNDSIDISLGAKML